MECLDSLLRVPHGVGLNELSSGDLEKSVSKLIFVGNFFFFLRLHSGACIILVPLPGIKPRLPTVGTYSPNHWTAREVLAEFCSLQL